LSCNGLRTLIIVARSFVAILTGQGKLPLGHLR
jgi:hypothetical protein